MTRAVWLYALAPGAARLREYDRTWFGADVAAGVSVAAVAVPTAIAYAQLAGFPPIIGLYASLAPLLVYAALGTSRQLIVNPDAATCAMVAAVVAPLSLGDAARHSHLAASLAVFTGLICVVAGLFRLGFLADYLGKPVLVGFMNGIAVSIVLGQIGHVFGVALTSGRVVPRLLEFIGKLPETHVPTLAVGLVTFMVLRGVRRFAPALPAPLVAVVTALLAVELWALDSQGVHVLGHMPAGLPPLGWTPVAASLLEPLVTGAAAIALVSMTSGMATARSFAARNRYEIDVDRDLVAIGACNVAAGLSHGFAVTGAGSRTAVGDSMGGRSQVTGLVAAATIAVVLLFFTGPLGYLPVSALGSVLIVAGVGLFDWRALVRFRRVGQGELVVSVAAMLGVVALGAVQGIGIAVGLSMLLLLRRSSRPADGVLGRLDGAEGFVDLAAHEGAVPVPGLVLYRFTAPLVFYNATYFQRRLIAAAAAPGTSTVVVDAAPIVHLDSTGADTIALICERLKERGIRLVLAGVLPAVHRMLDRSGALATLGGDATFATLRSAVAACERQGRAASLPARDELRDGPPEGR